MKKIKVIILAVLLCILPIQLYSQLDVKAASANKSPIDISLVYGGIYQNKMVVFFKVKTPENFKTYWKNPGFGGIAPEFVFDKSISIHDIQTYYNFPKISTKGGIINYVLDKTDYIAMAFQPDDPSKPINFKGKMVYGYCDNLCRGGTYDFNQSFSLNQIADAALLKSFFADQPIKLTAKTPYKLENIAARHDAHKNLLISFDLQGFKTLDPEKFIYYIDTDFEVKKPIIRKVSPDRFQVSIDLYEVYKKPENLTLILVNNEDKIVKYQTKLTYKN